MTIRSPRSRRMPLALALACDTVLAWRLRRPAVVPRVSSPAGDLAVDPALTASDHLAVALHTIDDFGRSIQSADAKSGALAAVLGLMIGGLVNDTAGDSPRLLTTRAMSGGSGSVLLLFAVGLVIAGAALAMTQVPRLATGRIPSRLAFPSVARAAATLEVARPGSAGPGGWGAADTGAASLLGEAWQQAEVLAAIAMTKFRYLRLALFATCASVVAFLAWFVIVITNGA